MGKTLMVSSFDEMARVSAHLLELSESYESLGRELMQEVQSTGSVWEGADSTAFINRFDGLREDLLRMSEKLRTASETLKKQHDNYLMRQDENIVAVSRLLN